MPDFGRVAWRGRAAAGSLRALVFLCALAALVGAWAPCARAEPALVADDVLRQPVAARAAPRQPARRAAATHHDGPHLRSAVALVIDRETDEVLFSRNPQVVVPIASITKLMTALVVVEAGVALDEELAVTPEDVSATVGSNGRRRLAPGTRLTRGEMLRLALMASENRAAHVLARYHPGGVAAFVEAMNVRARLLGMVDSSFVEPTGLSSDNRSSAQDLALLVRAASEHPIIGQYSTAADAVVESGRRWVQFRNTNRLVSNPEWDIALQKTGYIAAAGRCLVMQARLAGRQLIMVLLDSAGRSSRFGDAQRLRRWLFDSARSAQTKAAPAAPTARDGDDRVAAGPGSGDAAPQPR